MGSSSYGFRGDAVVVVRRPSSHRSSGVGGGAIQQPGASDAAIRVEGARRRRDVGRNNGSLSQPPPGARAAPVSPGCEFKAERARGRPDARLRRPDESARFWWPPRRATSLLGGPAGHSDGVNYRRPASAARKRWCGT
jgi:hypothetical protein